MKKNLFLFAFVITVNFTFCQNYTKLADYTFKSIEDYKSSEKQVLECVNYLFNTPFEKNSLNRLSIIQYLLKWMEGTPDYVFSIDKRATKLTKGNSDLLGMYFAAITKTVLDNTENKLTDDEIYLNAQELMIAYCSDSSNNMKPSKTMKKIIKSRKE